VITDRTNSRQSRTRPPVVHLYQRCDEEWIVFVGGHFGDRILERELERALVRAREKARELGASLRIHSDGGEAIGRRRSAASAKSG
jgi:hypothetical protein